MPPNLVILFVLWVVLGLLVGALASLVTKSDPPYGLSVDVIASVLTMIVIGLMDYFILPLIGLEDGPVFFGAALAEPLFSAVLVLWLLRVIKRRQQT